MVLRRAYKQTEVGSIPEDWEIRPLHSLSNLIIDGTHITPEYKDLGIPFLRVTDIQSSEINFDKLKFITPESHRLLSQRCKPEKGDLLLSKNGTVGIPKLVTWDWEFSIFVSLALLKLKPQILSATFLEQFFKSDYLTQQIEKRSKQGTVINLHLEEIREILIPVPPSLEEQHAIATALSDVDALLASLDALIAKKRLIQQGAMQELLTGKRRLPGFSGEWEKFLLGDLEKNGALKLSRGKVISKIDIERKTGDYPIYSSSVKNEGIFGRYGEFMFDEELITWSVDGGGDFFYRPKHKFSVTNVCGFMRVDKLRINCQFLALQLQLLHSYLNFDYQTKAHPSVIRKAYYVSLPHLSEQKAIADAFTDVNKEIRALEQQRDKTRLIKQGMMQELLTGRTRLV